MDHNGVNLRSSCKFKYLSFIENILTTGPSRYDAGISVRVRLHRRDRILHPEVRRHGGAQRLEGARQGGQGHPRDVAKPEPGDARKIKDASR